MANDKKFIVKNGLLTPQNVVIGSNSDTGENLQVTGTSKLSGDVQITQSTAETPSIDVHNSGGYLSEAIVARFRGDSDSLQIINTGIGDYKLVNSQQNNGIIFYDSTPGVRILYNNAARLDINSAGNRFYGLSTTTIDNNRILTVADEGSGNGLDADTVDGLEANQFVRSDVDDIMAGNYTIQQDLVVSGNLTVSGTTTTINTEEILLADNIITLNSNYTGSTPTEEAGIEIERGTLDNPKILWDETSDYWKLVSGNLTDLGRIITTADEGSGNGFDADTVDGLEGSQFLRSDVDDTANGNITILGDLTLGDNVGGAQINFDGVGNNRTLYSESGVIGFLNQAFNYAARSTSDGDWIVERDVQADRNLIAQTNITANAGDITATAGDVVAGDSITAQNNITATTGNIAASAGSVSAATTVTAGTDVIGQRFVDADNNSYLVDPAGTSTMNDIGIDDDIFHNGDTNTKLSFGTDDISLQTGGAERLGIDNDSVDATVTVTAPSVGIDTDLFHNGDTDTKIAFTTDELKIDTGGVTRLTANTNGVFVDNLTASGNISAAIEVEAPIYYDKDDRTYYGDFASTSRINDIALVGQIIHDGDTNTFLDFNAADSFQIVAGGTGIFTATSTTVTVDGDLTVTGTITGGDASFTGDVSANNITATTAMYSPIYYDADDNAYYGDFASTSIFNRISIDDYVVHNGDTDTYVGFSAADTFDVVTDGTTRLTVDTTYVTSTLDGIFPNLFAFRYYDAENATFYTEPAATSRMNDISLVGEIIHDGDTDTYLQFHNANQFRVVTGGAERLEVNNTFVLANNQMRSPIFYDSNNTAYYGDFAGTSVMNDINIDDYVRHNGDTDTYIGFDAVDNFGVWTNNVNRLRITNANSTFSHDLLAPRFVDSNDNDYYVDPANASLSATLNGAVRIGSIANNSRWSDNSGNGGISLLSYGDDTATSNPSIAVSGNYTGTYALLYLNRIDPNPNPFNNGNRYIEFSHDGTAGGTIRGDGSGNLYQILAAGTNWGFWTSGASEALIVDDDANVMIAAGASPTYTDGGDNTPLVGTNNPAKLHVGGSIYLNNNDDAIIFGRGTGSFLKDEELAFGWGSGWYMTDATYLRVRNNAAVYSTGDYYGSRFYAEGATAYYLDPNGDSQLNTIDIDDYIRHRGDTNTYIGFAANDTFRVWTGGVQRLNIDNNSADFAVNVYAPSFIDSDDNTFFIDGNSTSVLRYLNVYSGDSVGEMNVGRSSTQRIRQYITDGIGYIQYWQDETDSTDHSLRFEILSSSSGTNTFQFNRPISMTGTGAAGYIFASRYYDADDNTYYGDFASTSIMKKIQFDQSNVQAPTATDATTGARLILYPLGSGRDYAIGIENEHMWFNSDVGYKWYTDGIRRAELNDDYFFHNSDIRAPIFYDLDNTNFYVDPASTSNLNGLTMAQVITGPGITGYAGTLIREDNRTISPSELAAGRLKFGFTSWNNNNTSPYADFLHMRSYTDASGGADNLVMFKKSGIGMRIWQRSWGSATAYSSYVDVPLYNINPGSGNNFYASIYYDADDTAYYVDPNSTSYVSGEFRVQQSGTNGFRILSPTGTQSLWVRAGYSGAPTPTSSPTNIQFQSSGSSAGTFEFWCGNALAFSVLSNYAVGAASLRAPIFYDSNDTNYYVDPANISHIKHLEVAAVTNSASYQHAAIEVRELNYGGAQADTYAIAPRIGFHWGGRVASQIAIASNGEIRILNNPGTATENFRANIGYFDNSARAPIFYDSNDTNYYGDFAATSRLANLLVERSQATSILTVRRLGSAPGNNTTAFFENQFSNHSWGLVGEFRTGGNSGGDRPSISWSSALTGTTWSAGMFQGDSWQVRQNHGYRHGGWGTLRFDISTSGNATFYNGVYAPIYYDSNNTAYYLDPTGDTNLTRLSFYSKRNWESSQNPDSGYVNMAYRIMANGRKVYPDEEFNDGANGTNIYNNAGGSALSRARISDASAPNESKVIYRYTRSSGSNGTSPGFGGFYFAIGTTRNRTIVCKWRARMAAGRSFVFASNAYGSGGTAYWVTDNVGTGKWEEYTFVVRCGNGGSFSSTMFFYVVGGASTGTLFDLAAATCYIDTDHERQEARRYFASNSMYSPIYYDNNDSSYYLDPNTTGTSLNVRGEIRNPSVWINDGDNVNNYNENIRLFNASNGVSVIAFSASGTGGTPATSILGYPTYLETRRSDTWEQRIYAGYAEARGSYRAPIFYDSNNTGYYVDPASTTQLRYVLADDWFRAQGATGFYFQTYGKGMWSPEAGGNSYGNVTTYGGGRNGWQGWGIGSRHVFMSTGGDNVGIHDNSRGWIMYWNGTRTRFDYGYTEAAGSFRAPIFYDVDNTGYYGDFASTNRFNQTEHLGRMWYSNYLVSRNQGGLMGDYNSSGTATKVIWTIGESWPLANMYGLAYDYGSGYDHHLALRNNGTTYSRFGFAGGMFLSGTGTAGGDFRAPIFYDSNNTAYYFDGASRFSTRFEGVNNRTKARMGLSGQTRSSAMDYDDRVNFTGDQNYWIGSKGWSRVDMNAVADWGSGFIDSWSNPPNQPSGTSHWVGTQAYHYSNGSARYGWQMVGGPIGNLRFRNTWSGFSAWRTVPMLDVNDGNTGAMYAGIYYDANNTGFYMDPASTSYWSTSQQNGYHTFLNYGIGVTGTYSASRLQLVFAMGSAYRPNAAGTSTANMYGIGWSHPNAGGLGGANQLNDHGMLIINNGGFRAAISSRAVFSADVRTPIYYDWNDTGYYLDPNSTSNAALRIRGGTLHGPNPTWGRYLYVGTNGNVSSEACVATTNGNLHLDSRSGSDMYLQWYVGRTVFVSGAIQATIYYDRNNTAYYTDPASTSRLNEVVLNDGVRLRSPNGNYGSFCVDGAARGGYEGFSIGDRVVMMHDNGGVAGMYNDVNNEWMMRFDLNSFCILYHDGAEKLRTRTDGIQAQAFFYSSDERLKENIVTIENAVDKVKALRGVEYNWKDGGQRDIGLIAQEVREVIPEVVRVQDTSDPATDVKSQKTDKDKLEDVLSIEYGHIVGLLVEATKEQQRQIENQNSQIEQLKKMVDKLLKG